MPNKSTLYLILLTGLLAIYTVFDYSQKNKLGTINPNFKAIPIKTIDEIDEIEISSASGKVSISRSASIGWNITHPVKDRAESEKIDNILESLTELKKFDSITSRDAPSRSEMGLTDSALSVKLLNKKELIGQIIFGNTTGVVDTIYAQWNEKNSTGDPFFCWADIKEVIDVPFDKVREKKLVTIPIKNIGKIEIKDQSL